ncbi:hypothetical protein NGRA_2184 [Nosema granulosis]|uniref:Uncharacterized protein n=1 Tax=Nosema granulosis TaxID=83296 RepID=A0A9P6KYP5_9MICR|nr:hypothetical protein NGRA_2184 [Nosema granulosis]
MEYNKPEKMIVADSLSRIHMEDDIKKDINIKRSLKQQEGKWKKHVIQEENKKCWVFDDGRKAEVPEVNIRKGLIEENHKLKGHRSMLSVYYAMKPKYYWPGMKN